MTVGPIRAQGGEPTASSTGRRHDDEGRDHSRQHPHRTCRERVAQWVLEQAPKRGDADCDLIDLAEVALPQIDEPFPPAMGRYTHSDTQQWATTVATYDGYVLVTPECNHSFPGVLKNALDRVYAEWNNKAVGLVSYGVDGGVRAVEALRARFRTPQRDQITVDVVQEEEAFQLRTRGLLGELPVRLSLRIS